MRSSLGSFLRTPSPGENRQFRQSIYPKSDIKAGEVFGPDNLKICRPGFSLPPVKYDDIVGKRARRDIAAGDRLTHDDI